MEKIRVKWLKSHPEYSYFKGDISELSADKAAVLTESGHVLSFPGVKEKEDNTLPADLPCREILFSNGFDTMEKIKEAGNALSEIKGITVKSAEKILSFIEA